MKRKKIVFPKKEETMIRRISKKSGWTIEELEKEIATLSKDYGIDPSKMTKIFYRIFVLKLKIRKIKPLITAY